MNKKVKFGFFILFGIFIFLTASAGIYFLKADEKSPAFAIKSVEESITNHDRENFYKFVNVDGLLNSSYDEVLEGLADSDKSISIGARDAVKNFTQILKTPLLNSLKAAIDDYVATGKLNNSENLGVKEILAKTGINKIEYRGVKNISIDGENPSVAVADIKIFQPELDNEFVLKFVLNQKDNGNWQIVGVQNFRDFVTQIGEVRRVQLEKYLSQSDEIISVHDEIINDAEQKYNSILARGSLGQESIRADLRKLMLDVVKKDWETRKQELSNLNVPQDAETLHNIRMKICDLKIAYAAEYADWMTDKKAATIKSAEEKRRQAQTLMAEAKALEKRMAN